MFTPAGDVITTSPDTSLILWNSDTGQQIRSFAGLSNLNLIIDVWLANESTLVAVMHDGSVYFWKLNDAELQRVVPGDPVVAGIGVQHATPWR